MFVVFWCMASPFFLSFILSFCPFGEEREEADGLHLLFVKDRCKSRVVGRCLCGWFRPLFSLCASFSPFFLLFLLGSNHKTRKRMDGKGWGVEEGEGGGKTKCYTTYFFFSLAPSLLCPPLVFRFFLFLFSVSFGPPTHTFFVCFFH